MAKQGARVEIINQLHNEVNQKYNLVIPFAMDGKIHRKDHVWAVGSCWFYNCQEYFVINYGSWKYADQYTIKSWTISQENKKFKKAYTDKTIELSKSLKEEKEKKHAECKAKWEPLFSQGFISSHEYLTYKGVKIHNARVSKFNDLMIPFYNESGFTGIQRVDKDGKKLFSSGIEIQGSISPLMDFSTAKICYVSEGFATAATIQEIFPEIPSICAANSGNIIHAVKTIRKINPNIKICIAADNDKNRVGEFSAKKAASSDRDIIYIVARFSGQNNGWTDFNDLAQFESVQKVKDQLSISENDFANIKCLGHNEDTYFYSSSLNQQIIELKQGAHTKSGLKHIMSLDSYWYKNYGIKDEDGNYKAISWDKAEFDLKFKCQTAGIFNPRLVRGLGVWKDGENFVLNDGQFVHNKPDKTKYHYQKLSKSSYDLSIEPYDCFEMQELLCSIESFSFKNPKENIYLAAWIIQAQIFACIPWRFHLWITGKRGTGKSSIIELFSDLLHDPNFTPNSTAAGIRQVLGNDARPSLYDESEADDKKINAVVEMARQMSSNNGAQTIRGTSSGKSISYNTQTIFLFGSIQVPILNSADQSRIFVTEMNIANNSKQYKETLRIFAKFSKNKNKLFNRVFSALPSILISIEIVKDILKCDGMEARQADQIASMVACYHVYHDDKPITEETALKYLEKYDLKISDYIEDNREDESEKCIDTILSTIITHQNDTVSSLIEVLRNQPNLVDPAKNLGAFGIRLMEKNVLFIASKNINLLKKLQGYPNFSAIIKRNNVLCVDERCTVRIQGKTTTGLKIRI